MNQKDNTGLKDVEIKLNSNAPLKTDENGKVTTDFIEVETKLTLAISKNGYSGVTVPTEVTVNELTNNNFIFLKMEIKEVKLFMVNL